MEEQANVTDEALEANAAGDGLDDDLGDAAGKKGASVLYAEGYA